MSWASVRADGDSSVLYNFVTRPDLKAPKWNVEVYDEQLVSPGYWFVAPYERIGQKEPGGPWIGPHIYDGRGELVWSGAHLFNDMSVMDFRVSTIHGKDMISLIRPELYQANILDNHFHVVEEIPIEGLNMHDFNVVDGGQRALVLKRNVRNATRAMSMAAGLEHGECEASFHSIEELDTVTWQPVWTWDSYGKIGLEEGTMASDSVADLCKPGGAWDYLHANAVDKCPDGDYLLSARHTDTVYQISRADGHIVWRLGGVQNDFQKDFKFSRQHDVRCRTQNDTHTTMSFLDNARGEDPQPPTNAFSRGLEVAVDHENMQATIVAHYSHPSGPGGYAFRRGNYQVLPNDNIFICWSEQSLQTEHIPGGQLVTKASLASDWLGTYRSYKFPFVGRPLDPPDIYSRAFDNQNDSTITIVYASWNGATDVASWRMLKTDGKGEREIELMSSARQGFETWMAYEGYASFVFVQALDASGSVIGRSNVVRTVQPSNLLASAVAEEELWLQGDPVEAVHQSQQTSHGAFYGFVAGLLCGGILSVAMLGVWCVRRSSISILPERLPWHQKAEGYAPLAEKNGRVSMSES